MLDLHGADISAAASVIVVDERLLAAGRNAGVTVIYLAVTYQPDLSEPGGPSSRPTCAWKAPPGMRFAASTG